MHNNLEKFNQKDLIINKIEPFRCLKCLEIPLIITYNISGMTYIDSECLCQSKKKLNISSFLNEFSHSKYLCFDCKKIITDYKSISSCSFCLKIFCNECIKNHCKFFPEHKTFFLYLKDFICVIHNENYNSYCLKCKINLCDKCKISHQNHNIKNNEFELNNINKLENIFFEYKKIFLSIDLYKNIKNDILNKINNKENKEKIEKSYNSFYNRNEKIFEIIKINFSVFNSIKPNYNYIILKNILNNKNYNKDFIPNYNNLKNFNEIINKLLKDFYMKSIIDNSNFLFSQNNNKKNKFTLNGKKCVTIISDCISCMILLHDGRLVTGYFDIKIYAKNDLKLSMTIQAHQDLIGNLKPFKDGRLISCSRDTSFKFWLIGENNYTLLKTIEEHKSCVVDVLLLSNGFYSSLSMDKTIKIWTQNENFKLVNSIDCKNLIKCGLELCNCIIVYCFEFAVFFYDIKKNYENVGMIFDIKCLSQRGMIKLSDKKLCIVGFQYFYIIDAQLKQLETKVFAHTELIFSVLNLNDGTFLTGANDNCIKQWDINELKCISEKKKIHENGIISLVCLDNNILISAEYNGEEIKIWK